ncbi:fimbrial biogenesis outer membrane usher protein [Paraburkholderia dinghuensis]|uniref:Fimbrial biogenesis outer membrane usher protein n=1 Tax=Paraburkholderia dinghuensis TaxID=2305225 RepID=A0A3N6N9A3_9BURK|nr:fimbrial biogenesis outer membrane usher protein [Paraburkholderia dinghuensis]
MLLGSTLGVANIERFNKISAIEPGNYQVDIFVNGLFFSRRTIDFRAAEGGAVNPCLSDEMLTAIGVLLPERGFDDDVSDEVLPETDSFTEPKFPDEPEWKPAALSAQCVPLAERVPGASTKFDLSRLRLEISVPQAMMKRVPRGYVDPESLDPGNMMGYLNYDSSFYTASSSGNRTDSFYTGMNAGVNIGLWRIRDQSAFTYLNSFGGSTSRWNNIRTYAERPLISWRSRLLIGEDFTGGNLFSSIGYTGVHLESDDRMLPDSLRGYAPVINGIANTNARVVVTQGGNTIYQTTVAPGPFSITDLNPTAFQGDLTVTVFEANGQVTTFTVPFSAVPSSLRPGMSRYSFTAGEVRQIQNLHTPFAEGTYERGLTNSLTANGGMRVSSDYQSVLGGIVLGTKFGAFGLSAAWSNTTEVGGNRVNGWKAALLYSHTITETATTFSLASYRYSTSGYRDFADALNARAFAEHGEPFTSATFQQRNQFVVNLNQNFGRYGLVSLSASISDYYGNRSRDTQFQLSYTNHYKQISFNLSFVRQQTGTLFGQSVPPGQEATLTPEQTRLTNAVMFMVSIPLGSGPRSASVSAGVTNSTDQGTSYQASVSGTADKAQTLSYGLSATGDPSNDAKTFSGNVQKSFSTISVGANYSNGTGFSQAGANARGAVVAHEGGVTFGRFLGDTFAVVEAKGAEGATLRNTQGVSINSAGYAIVPSLTPYRYNDVAIDTKGINPNAELSGGQVRVAPYAGSSVMLRFATLTGRALLITASAPGGEPLPLGADVLDDTGAVIGVVGQGSQAYARVPADHGTLTLKWGERDEDQCMIDYDLKGTDPKAPITRLEAQCKPLNVAAPTVAAPATAPAPAPASAE